MHDRFFDARKLKCYYWDGKTDFKVVKESEDALNDRINQFGDWLDGQELPEELRVRSEDPQQDNEAAAQSKIKSKREEKAATKQPMLALQDYDEECYGDDDVQYPDV